MAQVFGKRESCHSGSVGTKGLAVVVEVVVVVVEVVVVLGVGVGVVVEEDFLSRR